MRYRFMVRAAARKRWGPGPRVPVFSPAPPGGARKDRAKPGAGMGRKWSAREAGATAPRRPRSQRSDHRGIPGRVEAGRGWEAVMVVRHSVKVTEPLLPPATPALPAGPE